MPILSTISGAILGKSRSIPVIITGQALFTTPGTYSWVCPTGVTSVSVVAVGGGGGGTPVVGLGKGGGGGGLGYVNNYPVTAGQTYTVVVGAGGTSIDGPTGGSDGGISYFVNTSVVSGGGGAGAKSVGATSAGGTFTGTGGGNGGSGAYGGGGVGGYSGNGGSAPTSPFNDGSSGSGGGGGSGRAADTNFRYSVGDGCSTADGSSSAGGGVGLFGQGSNGSGGIQYSECQILGNLNNYVTGGGGGSGGQSAAALSNPAADVLSDSIAGSYGGGAGYKLLGSATRPSGANGAVRIVWPGTTRLFPSTGVG